MTLLVLDLHPDRRGMASSLQMFVGSTANGLVAGVVAPLVMHFSQGDKLSDEDIAELMGCPPGTVRSRIYRAREAIASRLRPLLDTRDGERW